MDFSRILIAGLAAAATAATAMPADVEAAPDPIKGKLSKRGYTVIALAANGRAQTVAAKPKFRLVPPARVVTLHLRDRNGGYAGPVVIGGAGKKVIVGVRAGAVLGRIAVRRGYAVARAKPADQVRRLSARATNGRPIGAGILGRVRSSVTGRGGLGRDLDRDGLQGAFDVDDDGDLVFDNVDRSAATARAAAAADEQYNARWVMNAGLQVSHIADQRGVTKGASGYALNQNAAGPFAASGEFEKLRDLLMVERGALIFPLPSDPAELDCGYRKTEPPELPQPGLSYCSPGGTGGFITRNRKFPEQFDPDDDGFGSMQAAPGFAEGQDGLGLIQTVDPKTVFALAPNAKEADIEGGNVFIERLPEPQPERIVTLRTVIGTLPALASWGDGTRDVTIGYPVPQGAEGSESNGFTVKPNAAGDYVTRLTIWRPQRSAIADSGEGGGWIDLGGLTYTVVGKTAEQNRKLFKCPGSSYATSDGNLSVTPAGLLDRAIDQPVNRANTLTFSVNLSECLRNSGIPEWKPPGPTISLFVAASSAYGDVAEGLGFSFKPITAGGTSSSAFSGTWRFVGGAPGNEIEWTMTANDGETSHVGVIVYGGKTVTGGSQPAGWSCSASKSTYEGDTWRCQGGPLSTGQSLSGTTTLSAPGDEHMGVDMLICDASNACQGFGMTYRP